MLTISFYHLRGMGSMISHSSRNATAGTVESRSWAGWTFLCFRRHCGHLWPILPLFWPESGSAGGGFPGVPGEFNYAAVSRSLRLRFARTQISKLFDPHIPCQHPTLNMSFMVASVGYRVAQTLGRKIPPDE
jgi:hypothetical protein